MQFIPLAGSNNNMPSQMPSQFDDNNFPTPGQNTPTISHTQNNIKNVDPDSDDELADAVIDLYDKHKYLDTKIDQLQTSFDKVEKELQRLAQVHNHF